MKNRTILVESMDVLKLDSGFVMQIESGGERYVFLTGVRTCTADLIVNAADVPIYGNPEISGPLSLRYEKVHEANSIMRARNPLEPIYFTADNMGKEAVDEIKALTGFNIGPLSMAQAERFLKGELARYKSGKSTFRDRLVPKWKGKSRVGYGTINIPGSVFDKGVPGGVKGSGMYEMKEGGLYIRNEKPEDYLSDIVGVYRMELPDIKNDFADYAGRVPITYI